MAMELFILSDEQLNSIDEWQAAIDSEGYPLRLEDKTPIKTLKGFLPVMLHDAKTGFECNHWPAAEFMREMPDVNFGRNWKYVLTFRWGGDLNQVQAAWMAAAAYARAVAGVVFDEETRRLLSAVQAVQTVQDIMREMPRIEAIMRELKLP